MKVLLTTDLSRPAVNGVVISVTNLYKELKKHGHEVKILTLSLEEESYKNGDIYYIKAMKTGIYDTAYISFRLFDHYINEIIEWNPDIIHTNCEFSTYSFAEKIHKETKAPIVHTYHTMYEHYISYLIKYGTDFAKSLLYPFMNMRLKSSDLIIAPTGKVKSALLNNGMKKMIRVIPTGIDLSKFEYRYSEEEKKEFKKELGINENSFILGSLGRIAEEKNFSESLEIFKEVLRFKPNIYYIIVGDGPYKKSLEEEAMNLGIRDKIIFTGMVEPNNVSKYYQIFDCFISSTISETQGLTYIEALVNKNAIIARKDKATEDILFHGENSLLYENKEEGIKYLLNLIEDKDLLKRLQEKADESKTTFSTETFYEKIIGVYKEILDKEKNR